jgi:DNA-binding NtrC family response regulator
MGSVILVIDDEDVQRETLAGYLKNGGHTILEAVSGREGIEILRKKPVDLVITDYQMPDLNGMEVLRTARQTNPEIQVLMITAYGSVGGAVEAMREGALHYLEKPIDLDELDRRIEEALERRFIAEENRSLDEVDEAGVKVPGIITADTQMQEALNVAARASASRASVLVLGESGTGKELVAQAIHNASPRSGSAFVAINCAALNPNLLESELFGHEKGAYTGADRSRRGRIEEADGGTLFVDEVSEIPPEAQVKLLRVLQERIVEPVGGDRRISVDVRLISASNKDLEELIQDGTFRQDLYFRLKVVTVTLPPLRSRRTDIPLLLDHFRETYASENEKVVDGFDRDARDALVRYDYPGNVRELQNAVESAVVMARSSQIGLKDLPTEIAGSGQPIPSHDGTLPSQVEALERSEIERALAQSAGNQVRAAEILGISERNLRYKLRKYGLK